jgi:hypothetical protein
MPGERRVCISNKLVLFEFEVAGMGSTPGVVKSNNSIVGPVSHYQKFFFFSSTKVELRAYTFSNPPTSFVLDIFKIGSCKLICPGWHRTTIPLISAS